MRSDVRPGLERDGHRSRPGQGVGQGEPADEVLLRMLLRVRPRIPVIARLDVVPDRLGFRDQAVRERLQLSRVSEQLVIRAGIPPAAEGWLVAHLVLLKRCPNTVLLRRRGRLDLVPSPTRFKGIAGPSRHPAGFLQRREPQPLSGAGMPPLGHDLSEDSQELLGHRSQ